MKELDATKESLETPWGRLHAIITSNVNEGYGDEPIETDLTSMIFERGFMIKYPSGSKLTANLKEGNPPEYAVGWCDASMRYFAQLVGNLNPTIQIHRVPPGLSDEQVFDWLKTVPHLEITAVNEKTGETHVFGNATDVGRNDPCPCGSGRKFKKCCCDPARHN
jgi:hypothetical protein